MTSRIYRCDMCLYNTGDEPRMDSALKDGSIKCLILTKEFRTWADKQKRLSYLVLLLEAHERVGITMFSAVLSNEDEVAAFLSQMEHVADYELR